MMSHRYYNETTKMATGIYAGLAIVLGERQDFFDPLATELARSTMRLLRYPASGGDVDERNRGISMHTDFECFTIMYVNATHRHFVDSMTLMTAMTHH